MSHPRLPSSLVCAAVLLLATCVCAEEPADEEQASLEWGFAGEPPDVSVEVPEQPLLDADTLRGVGFGFGTGYPVVAELMVSLNVVPTLALDLRVASGIGTMMAGAGASLRVPVSGGHHAVLTFSGGYDQTWFNEGGGTGVGPDILRAYQGFYADTAVGWGWLADEVEWRLLGGLLYEHRFARPGENVVSHMEEDLVPGVRLSLVWWPWTPNDNRWSGDPTDYYAPHRPAEPYPWQE